MKCCMLDLPTGVQAFFLLQAKNLTPDLEKLVKTTTFLFCDMKEKIPKSFEWLCGRDSGGVPVKKEECYYANWKGNYTKDGCNKKGNNFGKSKSKLRTNPMNSGGNIVICHEFDWTKYFESKLPSSKGLRNKYDCAYYFGNRKSWFWDW